MKIKLFWDFYHPKNKKHLDFLLFFNVLFFLMKLLRFFISEIFYFFENNDLRDANFLYIKYEI